MSVKLTSSGWCHTVQSRYYSRIKHCEVFEDVWCCVYDGKGEHSRWNGDVPEIPEYSRNQFGWSWLDEDRDGQNARTEALILQSTGPLTYTDETERLVARGRWRSPYTNDVLFDASAIDIDHIVPLKWAWDHGAWRWSYDLRKQFANDQVNLFSVESSVNRSKGSRGPDEWMPDVNTSSYLTRWKRILLMYGLRYTKAEAEAISTI